MRRYIIVEWGGFLLFLLGQLMVIQALGVYSLNAKKWLDENRPNDVLQYDSEWLLKNGLLPYIEVALVLIVVSIVFKIFEKHIPMGYVVVPMGILLIFISLYIDGLAALTLNSGGLLDRWKRPPMTQITTPAIT